jgi:cell division protein FtsZ
MSHQNSFGAKIKVIGIGGGGGNAVNTMIRSGLDGVQFIVANTDSQALEASLAHHKIQLGKELTKGLGAGADPDIGRDAALEDRHELQELLSDADMVFITAGMGGGTGTGAAAVVAQIARELGALTVAVVTKPFTFEGKRRRRHAEMGIARLREAVDTLITIPNQRLLQIATPDLSMLDAFKLADNVLVNAVRGISDIINTPGLINVDFADVKTVMSSMGHALMGIGYGQGPERSVQAAKQAISSPLLEDIDIEGATGILINITAGTNVSIMEVNNACMIIQEAAHEDANIIFGAVIDESLGEEIRITVIATGFPVEDNQSQEDFQQSHQHTSGQSFRGSSNPISAQSRNNPALLAAQMARPFNSQRPLTQQSIARPVSTIPQQGARVQSQSPSHQLQYPAAPTTGTHNSVAPSISNSISNSIPTSIPTSNFATQIAATNNQENSSTGTKSTASMNIFQEARNLTDWSLGEVKKHEELPAIKTHDQPGVPVFAEAASSHQVMTEIQQDAKMDGSLASMVFRQVHENISHGEEKASNHEDDLSSMNQTWLSENESLELAPHNAASSHEFSERQGAELDHESLIAAIETDQDPWGLNAPTPSMDVTSEIDRKIDEALALASKLGQSNQARNTAANGSLDPVDDLDLPAFLRHGTSELPGQ